MGMTKQNKIDSDIFYSDTYSIKTGMCGNIYIHMLYTDKEKTKFHRVRADLGKSGTCARSHLEVEVAFINATVHNTSNSVAIKTLTEASGHKCQSDGACHDLMIRMVIQELMKIQT
jgi:hypothetical protein